MINNGASRPGETVRPRRRDSCTLSGRSIKGVEGDSDGDRSGTPARHRHPARASGRRPERAIRDRAFLDSPKIATQPNTLRAYTNVLDRVAEQLDPHRVLSAVDDGEIGDALLALWGEAKPATWNRNRAAVGSWLAWCRDKRHWDAPGLPTVTERLRETNDDTKAVSKSRIDRLCLDLPNKQARVTVKGGDVMWITWGTDTAHLLPRLIAGREHGPLFLSEYRPGPHRRATTDPRDICPETGRARLGYDRVRVLLAHYGDRLRPHQLRHSSATHLGEANVSANVIMAKTGHKNLRSVQRSVQPGLAAVHQATETLSGPRRRG